MRAQFLSPQGLWDQTKSASPSVPAMTTDLSCEVAIIGGGFCGLSAALHLAEAGTDAVVLEAETPGWGASGRNGGQVIAGLKLDPHECLAKFGRERGQALHRFGAATADLVFSLIERFQIRCEAHRDGWIQAAYSARTLNEIARRVSDLQSQGEDVELIDRERMATITGTAYYRGGMLDRRSGMVQPLSYALGLAAAARAAGARLYGGARVAKIEQANGRWALSAPSGRVTAKHCLIATNGYTDDLHPALKTAMIAVQSYQLATDPLPPHLARAVLPSSVPVSDLPHLGIYYRRDDAGRFISGGRGSLTDRDRPDLFALAEENAYILYPALREVGFTVRWGGKLALTKDHLPRLATLAPGLLAAYGCNGRGVALATAMGKLAAERIRGQPHEELPIATLPPAHYPLHRFRLPAMTAIAKFRRLRNRFARG
jgi:glycine/D-amino acid oxidase-like deaminating enzyme